MKVSKKIRLMSCCGLAFFTLAACGTNQNQSTEKQNSSTTKVVKEPIATSIARKVQKKFEKPWLHIWIKIVSMHFLTLSMITTRLSVQ